MTAPPESPLHIAIIGGGPAALYLTYELVLHAHPSTSIDIFEKDKTAGPGMPYSEKGAGQEHLSNVSAVEIPELPVSCEDWIHSLAADRLKNFGIEPGHFNKHTVLPRLLLGEYFGAQFLLLRKEGRSKGFDIEICVDSKVTDISVDGNGLAHITTDQQTRSYSHVIICSGHHWPLGEEGNTKNYFDSPYPPAKLQLIFDHPVAIRGSSLTAIDAVRTLSLMHGEFTNKNGTLAYQCRYAQFKLVMHSTNGLLPSVRFHQENVYVEDKKLLISDDQLQQNMNENDGFVELDFVFEKRFLQPLKEKDADLYQQVGQMKMEEFVELVMSRRERADPFVLLQRELDQSKQSLVQKKSIHWKELLTELSFAMNYPAKHFSAEDKLRLDKTLMPLISIVIAFIPQESAEILLALHNAGRLELVEVDEASKVQPMPDGGIVYSYQNEQGEPVQKEYETYIDCRGQSPLSIEEFPFRALVDARIVSQAYLKFRDPKNARPEMKKTQDNIRKKSDSDFYLKVPGLAINDHFQVVDGYGKASEALYLIAVPFIAGYNPDYSGLDFCKEASSRAVKSLLHSANDH